MRHPDRLESGHPFRQWKTRRLPGDLTLTGYSRAADKTFFHIPELRCALDAGLAEGRAVDTVLLTHTHHDHAKDLDFLAAQGADVYLPAAALPYAHAYLRASAELNHGAAYDPDRAGPPSLHGVHDGQEFTFGRRGHHVRVVACDHKVPCVGYAVSEVRRVLRPEYEQLRRQLRERGEEAEFGPVMAARRRAGEDVEHEVRRPLFAFLGDTHPAVFDREPWLLDFPVVITECTFLHDSERARADRVGHTVWSALAPHIHAHPDTLFVLTHFSLRHTDGEVVAFFADKPDNILPWAHPGSLLPEQHQ
jgi:ribonuclease Z